MASLVDRGRPWALPGLLGFAVVAFACGSSSISEVQHVAHGGRWLVLFAVLGLAGASAWRISRTNGVPPGLWVFGRLAAAFAGLAVLSTAWSPTPRLTFERGVSLWILFAAAAGVAVVADADPVALRRVFVGLAAGAGLIAVTGFLMLAAGVDAAAQEASSSSPWRFRGFGENPNTIPVLGAAAMPIVTWLWLTTTERVPRFLWAVSFAGLLATAVATQSRGGLAGAFVGVTLVLGVLVERWPRKAMAIASFGSVVVLGLVLRQATQPLPPAFYSAIEAPPPVVTIVPSAPRAGGGRGGGPTTKPSTPHTGATRQQNLVPPQPTVAYRTAELPPRSNEIGFPTLSRARVTNLASGRVAAWMGALDLVKDRLLLGYGFGTESRVFVDRWYVFAAGLPENSSIGILLQLGVVGFAIMLALLVLLVWGGVRALLSQDAEARSLAIVGLGTLAGALTVTFVQSYIYSVGNVASATVWITAFILGTGVLGKKAGHARA